MDMDRIRNEWCGNCPRKKKDKPLKVKVLVDNDIYEKLVSGEPVKILVESIGKQMIEVTMTHGNKEKKDERRIVRKTS